MLQTKHIVTRPARPAGKGISRLCVPGSRLKNEGVGVSTSAPSPRLFLKMPVFSGQNKGFQKKKCRPILTGHKNDVSGNDERQISTSRANTTEISLFFTNRR